SSPASTRFPPPLLSGAGGRPRAASSRRGCARATRRAGAAQGGVGGAGERRGFGPFAPSTSYPPPPLSIRPCHVARRSKEWPISSETSHFSFRFGRIGSPRFSGTYAAGKRSHSYRPPIEPPPGLTDHI